MTLKTRREGSNGWTAKLAAWLFLVQMLLGGFSMGADAQAMPRDQFGNVICTAGEAGWMHGGGEEPGHHSGILDCCALGCGMAGADRAPAAPDVSVPADLAEAAPMAPFVLREDIGSRVAETPRSTRAPPLPA